MGYAVHLYFDPQTEARINTLWHTLADQGISSVVLDVDSRPHISLAVFRELAVPPMYNLLESFARETLKFSTWLSSVGTFPTKEGVVFLAPIVTAQLLTTHYEFHERLTEIRATSMDYYRPGQWVPHCTVAINLSTEKVLSAVDVAREADVFGAAELQTIGLVEFRPVKELCGFSLTGR